MSNENMLFKKPIGVLARSVVEDVFGPPVEAKIKFAQNGLKIRVGEENFVAKTIDEAMEIVKSHLVKLEKELKKNDK